jgi:hypothetical protein
MQEASLEVANGPDPSIDRPVMLLGTGRSGTTLAMQLTACHPDVAWISQYTNRFAAFPELAVLSRVSDLEPLRRGFPAHWKWTPQPRETISFTKHVTEGMFAQPRELDATDVTPATRARYRRAVIKHLHWQGKPRFMQKHTGFPRTRYLREIFPDARFIHILRDGRAVANSMLHVAWWDGTLKSWWWGPMPPEYEDEYRASGESAIVLAAIVWKRLVDLIEPAMAELPAEQALTLRYDALVRDPEGQMALMAEVCGLEPSHRFEQRVHGYEVDDADDKWKRLPRDQREMLEGSLADHLERLGFD